MFLFLSRDTNKWISVNTYLIKQNGNKYNAERRTVKPGLSYNGNVQILAGLTAGDKVITTGYQDLNQGDALIIK